MARMKSKRRPVTPIAPKRRLSSRAQSSNPVPPQKKQTPNTVTILFQEECHKKTRSIQKNVGWC